VQMIVPMAEVDAPNVLPKRGPESQGTFGTMFSAKENVRLIA
jgi:hypothetical protein